MFEEIAAKYQKSLLPYTPCANLSDRAAWEGLDEEWRKASVALGERYLGFEWPYLSASDFLEFSKTGNRVHFENKMFSKRHALDALVLAECVENKGRFLEDIINGIFSICDESAWNLPPHNSYERDKPQLPLPDLTAPVLDLFCCEAGAVLATASYLLAPALDRFSPFITKRIRYELERRIFTPYLTCHFWWMGDGVSPMNNWTIWCTQNVLLSAFLTDTDSALRRQVFEKACKSADYFLAEYGEDGCCDEGAQYYRHAGLCLYLVLELCNRVTGGAFSSLAHTEKIKNIASYIYKVHVEDKYYVNFADCSPVAGRCSAREYLFGKLTGQPDMMRFAAADFLAGGTDSLLLPSENNLFYRLQNGFAVSEIRRLDLSAPLSQPDVYYPSVGLFAVRDSHLFLAVKAGDNADSHNHNDTGSFTVYRDGRPLFIDVGVESYTKKTFSPQRYEIWTMQSAWHNLPTFGDVQQHDGEAFCATGVECSLADASISMELSHAYPEESGLASYRRSARLIRGEKIVIRDSFSFLPGKERPVRLSLMTYDHPDTLKDIVRLTGARIVSVEEVPITDARLSTAWDHSLYRTLAEPLEGCHEIELEIR
ncbi:MAG: heparinase II/III family protein [Eubacteriales bacterium]|nr:heparinase II/III family protein [Eubacteriales bacterium]